MADQQILHPEVRQYFEGLHEGGLTATQALSVYEDAVLGGTQAGESELLRQQVLCLFFSALYWPMCTDWSMISYTIVAYMNDPTVIRTGPYDGHSGHVL